MFNIKEGGMGGQQPDQRTEATAATGGTVKRRGVIAAAAAVVVGIMAKQAGQSVAAAPTTMMTETANQVTATTSIIANHGTYADDGAFVVDASGTTGSFNGITARAANYQIGGVGVEAHAGLQNAGVLSVGGGRLYLASSAGPGVVGLAGSIGAVVRDAYTQFNCGVYGEAKTQANGYTGIGVHGKGGIEAGLSSTNATGVYGEANASKGVGVQGQSQGVGVYGLSLGSYGVVGVTTAPGPYSGITGGASADGAAAVAGGTSNPNAYAAYFSGNVVVDGKFTVIDPTRKHGAIKASDGQHHTLYSVESPEPWLEDFGTGTLVNGKVEINLDPTFADVIHTDDYHVFLTAHDDHHLHVSQRGGGGFTVEADTALAALKGKKAADLAGTFSYRVVAKPKSDNKAERLAKFTVPNIKIPTVADLPKVPEPPKKPLVEPVQHP